MDKARLNQIMMRIGGHTDKFSKDHLLKHCTEEELKYLIEEKYIKKIGETYLGVPQYIKTKKGCDVW